MQRDKGDAAFVYDMIQAARDVCRYIAGKSLEDFQRDDLLRSAVERKLELIGEAARGISPSFRAASPQVPWKKIMATRHILAHDYDEVNELTVWRIATLHTPALLIDLQPLLPPHPPDPQPEP